VWLFFLRVKALKHLGKIGIRTEMSAQGSDRESVEGFERLVVEAFRFLVDEFDFELSGVARSSWYERSVVYVGRNTGVVVELDTREHTLRVLLAKLVRRLLGKKKLPSYLDTAETHWVDLREMIALRAPSSPLLRARFGRGPMSDEQIGQLLPRYADALRRYATDILSGDFAVLPEAQKMARHL
jgi:hypothetical protein